MLNNLFTKIKRTPNRIKREILRIPAIQAKAEATYNQTLADYADNLPQISAEDTVLLNRLKRDGVCIIPIEELSIPSTPIMLKAASHLATRLASANCKNNYKMGIFYEDLMEYPEIFLWGLNEKLLDLIENYIGMPIIYHGLAFRRDIANGKLVDVRKWHLDPEDHRMVKIIVYLNDVTSKGGPYEYISQQLTDSIIKKLDYTSGLVSDKAMAKAIPQSDWQICTGEYGTVILADTCKTFHRAKPPIKTDRFSLTFCYTSIKPIVVRNTWRVSLKQWDLILSQLNQRQKECLYKKEVPPFWLSSEMLQPTKLSVGLKCR